MFEYLLPRKKLGYLAPLSVIDNVAYQYYQLLPDDMMVVWLPVGVKKFTTEDVMRALGPLEQYMTMFMERNVDIIIQGGIPLPALIGVEEHDKILGRMREQTGLPVTSDVESTVKAAKFLGMHTISLANKWNDSMNKVLDQFFRREGISVAGVTSQSMAPDQFVKMTGSEGINLAYELVANAFKNFPKSDGVCLGGGAWISFPLVEILEKEFGRPVITNETATIWHSRHLINYWQPISGHGRLLESE